jgi:hypothetical protein
MGYTPPGAAGVGGGEPANENKEKKIKKRIAHSLKRSLKSQVPFMVR